MKKITLADRRKPKVGGNTVMLMITIVLFFLLYGAGCVVGGANGADSMTAMMNSWAIVSGVVAAESAAKTLK